MTLSTVERLRWWARLARSSAAVETCYVWHGATGKTGYGVVRFHGALVYVHRLACYLRYGAAPIGFLAVHHPEVCPRRACWNPEHVRWGTREENEWHHHHEMWRNPPRYFVEAAT